MTQIAHAAHWLTSLAYFVPVVAFVGWLLIARLRDRRREAGRKGRPPTR